MTRITFYFIFLLALPSCSNDESTRTLSYSEIGASEKENSKTEPKLDAKNEAIQIKFDPTIFELCGGFKVDTMEYIEVNEVLDRGKYDTREKLNLQGNQDQVSFKEYTFLDSVARKNSFYNLLDCFDKTCESIELLDTAFISTKYHLLFVSDYSIHWISSDKNQDIKIWSEYLKRTCPQDRYHYIFEQLKNKCVRWMEYNEKAMNPI